jgi:Cd2+/Zn2+-exporting ATPase
MPVEKKHWRHGVCGNHQRSRLPGVPRPSRRGHAPRWHASFTAVEEAQGSAARRPSALSISSPRYTPLSVFLFALAIAMLVPPLFMAERGTDWIYKCLGAAGGRLPLRLGHLDARHHGQRPGRGGAPRHPDQRRRLSGASGQAWLRWPSTRPEPSRMASRYRPITCPWLNRIQNSTVLMAASLASRSDHPVSQAVATHATEKQRPDVCWS